MIKKAIILFFINGVLPTDKDRAAAAELEQFAYVRFRNASAVPTEQHALEICDGVAGDVPEIYAKRFPTAEKAIKAKEAEKKALQEKVADKPAPKAPAKAAAKPAEKPAEAAKPSAQWNPNA